MDAVDEDVMQELAYKVRLAALWILTAVAFGAYRTLASNEGAREVSMLGDSDFASYLLVLMVFAFLTLMLPQGLNRLANLTAGGIVGILQSIMLIDGTLGYGAATFNLMTAATVVTTWSVVWLAYRWHGATGDVRDAATSRRRDRALTASQP